MPRPEIINGQLGAQTTQRTHHPRDLFRLRHGHALSDFQLKPMGWKARPLEDGQNSFR